MRRTAALTAVLLLLCACNRDEEITADRFAPVITFTGCDDSGTYYVHPGESLTIVPQTDVPWTASDGRRGTVDYLPEFHDQPCYYPAWAPDCYMLRGISLPARNYPEGGTWTLPAAAWGYADNAGSDSFELLPPAGHGGLYTGMRIENAVAADGTRVKLPFVDFVMVRSATVGKSGWLGEISTEVTDVVDSSIIDN